MCIVEKSQSRIQRGDAPKSFPCVKRGLKRGVDWFGTTFGRCQIPKSSNALLVVHKCWKIIRKWQYYMGYYTTFLNETGLL